VDQVVKFLDEDNSRQLNCTNDCSLDDVWLSFNAIGSGFGMAKRYTSIRLKKKILKHHRTVQNFARHFPCINTLIPKLEISAK